MNDPITETDINTQLPEAESKVFCHRFYNSEIFTGYHNIIYGQWRFERIWGGNSHVLKKNFDLLEFIKYGIYKKFSNGIMKESGSIQIINHNTGNLIISLNNNDNGQCGNGRIFQVYLTKEILILQEPCSDGCSLLLTRLH